MAIAQPTTVKAQIIQEPEPLSLESLEQVLAYVQQLRPSSTASDTDYAETDAVSEKCRPEVWVAYLESERER